jgi:hypothetical protein
MNPYKCNMVEQHMKHYRYNVNMRLLKHYHATYETYECFYATMLGNYA